MYFMLHTSITFRSLDSKTSKTFVFVKNDQSLISQKKLHFDQIPRHQARTPIYSKHFFR